MRLIITIIWVLILTSCYPSTERPVDKMALTEIEKTINGYWKLKTIEYKDSTVEVDQNSDEVEYYEFEGLMGINQNKIDHHNGIFTVPTCQPACALVEEGNRKIIKYGNLTDKWELEIKRISADELVLADSSRAWTYSRYRFDYSKKSR